MSTDTYKEISTSVSPVQLIGNPVANPPSWRVLCKVGTSSPIYGTPPLFLAVVTERSHGNSHQIGEEWEVVELTDLGLVRLGDDVVRVLPPGVDLSDEERSTI